MCNTAIQGKFNILDAILIMGNSRNDNKAVRMKTFLTASKSIKKKCLISYNVDFQNGNRVKSWS